jgi:hypothetical protein
VKTGIDNSNKKTVTKIDHENKGILIIVTPGALMRNIVVKKLIAVRVDEAPSIICPATQKSVPGVVDESPEA